MDLGTETESGIGQWSGRLAEGQGLVAVTALSGMARTVHTSPRCGAVRHMALLELVPVYRNEDGALKATHKGRDRTVEWCEQCPPIVDYDWHQEAECRGTNEDFFTEDKEKRAQLTAIYCDHCPVAATCLDSEPIYPGMMGIYGGLAHTVGRGSLARMKEKRDAQRIRIGKRI